MADCTKTVEFLREKKRMCDQHIIHCSTCPISSVNNEKMCLCNEFINTYPDAAIEIVQKWSDENPVMTWKSKLRELLPNADVEDLAATLCPSDFFGKVAPGYCNEENPCTNCWAGEYREEKE